ncbi:MAG TPA: glycosyl hydrolase family 8, partial [Polyangiaceae bacterium]|nr:glycosyl hydrolase family 8 [Polyangiaceae bacterium]
GGAGGAGGSGNEPPGDIGTPCAVSSGMISDFEAGMATVLTQEGRTGTWEAFGDEAGTQTLTIEKVGDTACQEYALHTTGQGFSSYVGISANMKGTDEAPEVYDASKYTGIRFKAKQGASQARPVRFNLSTPFTEGEDSGGTCVDNENLDVRCYNHMGRFLTNDYELTSEWKTFTFCFDRDYYPLFVPAHPSNEERRSLATNVLKIQFQFNKHKEIPNDTSGEALPDPPADPSFDFWLDDVEFVTEECPGPTFTSSAGSQIPFPQNKPYGTCMPVTDAAKFNGAIVAAYNHWKQRFVVDANGGKRITGQDVENQTPSEAMGYGMMIAAAMGDKEAFDAFWSYTKQNLDGDGGVIRWRSDKSPGDGSATDGDIDIAYGLMMAAKQWGGAQYTSDAQALIQAILTHDMEGGFTRPGSNYPGNGALNDAYNPSYFGPAWYRAFQTLTGQWDAIIAKDYQILNACESNFGAGKGLVPDWCFASDGRSAHPNDFGAEVVGGFTEVVYGYDAARVPWRIGSDACLSGSNDALAYLNKLIGFFASKYENGGRLERLFAGVNAAGVALSQSVQNQMSFIGPIGVGALALSAHRTTADRAFRAVLDIIENPEFNRRYYPTTLGLITLLQMSGNFFAVP